MMRYPVGRVWAVLVGGEEAVRAWESRLLARILSIVRRRR